jgi:hypothetical protein
MTTDTDKAIHQHLLHALRGGNAFDTFDDIVAQVPEDRRFQPIGEDDRSPWQIVEHIRIALDDLASYTANENGDFKELDWPDQFWPKSPAPSGDESWDKSIEGCRVALARMEALVEDPNRDLLAPFPWAPQHTMVREILVAIQHNSYHLGQLVELSGSH